MSFSKKLFTAGMVASIVVTASVGTLPAAAAPLGPQAGVTSAAIYATPVQWRRGGFGGPRWFGPGLGAAIVGGIIVGGAITAAAIAEHRAEPAAIRRCGRDFPEFDPRSGTYIDRRGDVRVCPYLY